MGRWILFFFSSLIIIFTIIYEMLLYGNNALFFCYYLVWSWSLSATKLVFWTRQLNYNSGAINLLWVGNFITNHNVASCLFRKLDTLFFLVSFLISLFFFSCSRHNFFFQFLYLCVIYSFNFLDSFAISAVLLSISFYRLICFLFFF